MSQKLKSGEMKLSFNSSASRIAVPQSVAKRMGIKVEEPQPEFTFETLSEAQLEQIRKIYHPEMDKETFKAITPQDKERIVNLAKVENFIEKNKLRESP